MSATKTCKQCGVIKPLEQFRNYYGGRKGTYTVCKACEKINSRVKYLESKKELNDNEKLELQSIYQLWETQRTLGYQPPRTTVKGQKPVVDTVLEMMNTYKKRTKLLGEVAEEVLTAPPELLKWLTVELTEEPEYYMDSVYEELKDTYKPVLRIDEKAMMPIYDTTYSGVLDKILERFCEYEDKYYEDN